MGKWLKESMWAMTTIFRSNANIVRSNKLIHIFSELWPLVISKNQLHGLVKPKVAYN
jgi:hypothetical protein